MDRRTAPAAAYRARYNTKAWKQIRAHRLAAEPLCRMCHAIGHITAAAVVDHVIPHRGDETLFFDYENTQSLCKPHHDSAKQGDEARGFSNAIGLDGMPTDPRHPWNRPGSR